MKRFVICKKDLIGDRTYRVNKKYEIFASYFILTDEYKPDHYVRKGRWFTDIEFKIYFYTEQELRKIKLQKLNENSNL